MLLYKDMESTYKLLDYHITHSRLLLRSMRSKERDYNIDIVFKPVDKLLLMDSFRGLEITLCDIKEVSSLISDYSFAITNSKKVFCLKDLYGQKFYINAMALGVFHNQLGPNESSIKGIFDEFGQEILWYN